MLWNRPLTRIVKLYELEGNCKIIQFTRSFARWGVWMQRVLPEWLNFLYLGHISWNHSAACLRIWDSENFLRFYRSSFCYALVSFGSLTIFLVSERYISIGMQTTLKVVCIYGEFRAWALLSKRHTWIQVLALPLVDIWQPKLQFLHKEYSFSLLLWTKWVINKYCSHYYHSINAYWSVESRKNVGGFTTMF